MDTFLGELASGFIHVLQRILVAFESPKALRGFINDLGWDAPLLKADADALRTALSAGENAFQAAQNLIDQLEAGSGDELEIAAELIQATVPLTQAIVQLANPPAGGLAAPFDQAAFWQDVSGKFLDYLLLTYLEAEHPLIAAIVYGLGIADITPDTPAGANRIPYNKRTIDWTHLGDLVTAPTDHLAKTYHWNDSGTPFDYAKFVNAVANLTEAARLPVRMEAPLPALVADYYTNTNPALAALRELAVPIASINHADPTTFVEFGVVILPIPPDGQRDQAPVGFLISPTAVGAVGGLPGGSQFAISLKGSFDAADSVRLEVRPKSFRLGLPPGGVKIDAGVSVEGRPKSPWIIIGGAKSHRLELGGIRAGIGVQGPLTDPDITVHAGTGEGPSSDRGGASVILDFKDSDGFLQKMLGSGTQRFDFALLASWSSKHGFGFSGQAQLEANIPVHLSIGGVLNIDTVYVSIGPGEKPHSAALSGAIAGGLVLGPVAATVDRLGVLVTLAQNDAGTGNLGKLDLGFGFKPPNGLGIVIDAAAITGGGYIFFDYGKGEYAGVLELSLSFITIKAIGILDTKLPDGKLGFSFLIIITTEFEPIQLGFGFTLNGVGGMAGINRTMLADVLRAGLKNHILDSILFPVDPIKNATKIISDLQSVFPPAEGRYVFGPMLEIGWGDPTIIYAEIGVILEVPEPIRIAILGLLRAALPEPDAPIVLIHLDVLGIIDFGLKKLSLDASLYDSRILAFTLLGDMALRLSWGADPNFALAVGGLNPRFQPPPAFPTLHRLTLCLGTGDNPRLSLDTYMALTSNSAQFGAHLELYASYGVTLHGYLGFDALFIFSPFSFITEMHAGVDVLAGSTVLFSIHLDLVLAGPTPWDISGSASLQILFFSISVSFHVRFGEERRDLLPTIDTIAPITAALNNLANWSAPLPTDTERIVSFAKADEKVLLLHPMGALRVDQKVVPLGMQITMFGSAAPANADRFDIKSASLNGSAEATTPVPDYFAMGQFLQLSDSDKLTAPSYEPRQAGVTIGDPNPQAPNAVDLEVHYETTLIDDVVLPSRPGKIYFMAAKFQLAVNRYGAGSQSAVRGTGILKYSEPGQTSPIKNQDPGYVITTTDDMTIQDGLTGPSGTTRSNAVEILRNHLFEHPEDRGRLQIMPVHEAVAV